MAQNSRHSGHSRPVEAANVSLRMDGGDFTAVLVASLLHTVCCACVWQLCCVSSDSVGCGQGEGSREACKGVDRSDPLNRNCSSFGCLQGRPMCRWAVHGG